MIPPTLILLTDEQDPIDPRCSLRLCRQGLERCAQSLAESPRRWSCGVDDGVDEFVGCGFVSG